MADTQINQELRDFMQENNLDPLNHFAFAKLLMKQQEQIDEILKYLKFGNQGLNLPIRLEWKDLQ